MAEGFLPARKAGRLRTVAAIGVAVLAAVILPAYLTVPRRNNADPQLDALLVLGSPSEIDGTLTAAQRWRMDEAVREFRRGRAPHMLITGGPTSHGFVEADTMAHYARSQGIPASALVEERTAMTTIQNIRFSEPILAAHGWRRVEVISSAEHLPRAALLLQHSHLLWQTHAAPTPGRNRLQEAIAYAEEAMGTSLIRWFGLGVLPVLHALDVVQQTVTFAVRWPLWKAGLLR